jgi:small subunit ribosomal protein S1
MADSAKDDIEMQDVQNNQTQAELDLEMFERYLEADSDFDIPERGDLREGVIVEIRSNELLVNIGGKRDGIVPQSDLSKLDDEVVKGLHEGQTIDVVISRQPEDDGFYQLSMADALQQRDWITAQKMLESGEISTHKVIGYNKGGLTVEFFNLRGFVPASHVIDMARNLSEDQRRAELEGRIGDSMRLKVIEVDRKRRRLVMSQMLAEREYQTQQRERLLTTLKVGDVLNGEVRSLRPFGAFVDLGGADGLLHVSEIGWAPINHPREALQVGDKIDVQVIRLDPDNQRIGLSRKRLLPNPWDEIESRYSVGQILPVTITRVVDFGAFAQIEPGVEGLVHISEIADISVAEPLRTIRPGDKVLAKVLRVNGKQQRIGLSIRQAQDEVGEGLPAEEAPAAEDVDAAAPAEADEENDG